jgi:hypothetical protein
MQFLGVTWLRKGFHLLITAESLMERTSYQLARLSLVVSLCRTLKSNIAETPLSISSLSPCAEC